MREYSSRMECTLARIVSSSRSASARRVAEIGTAPGFLRASARTALRARFIASVASPSHSEDHTTCANGCCVRAWISAYGTGRMSCASPAALSAYPGLHVPRKPSVSHADSAVSSRSARRTSTCDCSPRGASSRERHVTRMASASAPYEITGACFSRV